MRAKARDLDVAFIRRTFNYDPSTGVITWADSTAFHKRGDVVGKASKDRYGMVRIGHDRAYLQRVAWVHYHGANPTGCVDHINRDKSDNRIDNLRDVAVSQNNLNTARKGGAGAGFRGVWVHSKLKNKFTSRISVAGRRITLGVFDTAEEASSAYESAYAQAMKLPVGASRAPDKTKTLVRLHVELEVKSDLVGDVDSFVKNVLRADPTDPTISLSIRSGFVGDFIGGVRVLRVVSVG